MKSLRERGFHSAHPTGWAESLSGNGVCMYVRHHFKEDQLHCSEASQTPITIHILKAHDDSYSRIRRQHKYKDKDNDNKNPDHPGQPSRPGQWSPWSPY